MKRIFLFILTNLAVVFVINISLRLLGLDRILNQGGGINFNALLIMSLVIGFSGSIISLLMSKPIAKWSTGAQLINGSEGPEQRWLVDTVQRLAQRAGIGMPEVAFYEGEPNAFATGAFRDSALVAVSTGLLQSMTREEVEAVLGHEVAHIANGDMVTLTLIQGVVNTFVVFLARVVGYIVDRVILKNERDVGIGYYVTVFACEIMFSVLASIIVAWFSRQREFRADAGSANLLGNGRPMINALARLGGLQPGALPQAVASAGITNVPGFMALFSTHPPVEQRIAALQSRQ